MTSQFSKEMKKKLLYIIRKHLIQSYMNTHRTIQGEYCRENTEILAGGGGAVQYLLPFQPLS